MGVPEGEVGWGGLSYGRSSSRSEGSDSKLEAPELGAGEGSGGSAGCSSAGVELPEAGGERGASARATAREARVGSGSVVLVRWGR